MNEPKIRIRKVIVDGEAVVFVDRIDLKNKKVDSLNHNGEWQKVPLYGPSPPEVIFHLYGDEGPHEHEKKTPPQA